LNLRPPGPEPDQRTSPALASAVTHAHPLDSARGSHRSGPRNPNSATESDAGFSPAVAPPLCPADLPEKLFRIEEVARFLRVSKATVYKLCKRGDLAHSRISNAIRVTPTDLEGFLLHRLNVSRPASRQRRDSC
jgi:excisionase family DNA binding protein